MADNGEIESVLLNLASALCPQQLRRARLFIKDCVLKRGVALVVPDLRIRSSGQQQLHTGNAIGSRHFHQRSQAFVVPGVNVRPLSSKVMIALA